MADVVIIPINSDYLLVRVGDGPWVYTNWIPEVALLPELAEAGAGAAEAGGAAAGASEAGAGAAEAGAGASEAGASSLGSRLGTAARGALRDFNDTPVGKFLGSSEGRMVTTGMQLQSSFNQRAQQQEQQTQQQEQGPQFA